MPLGALLLVVIMTVGAGCTSPESTRTRGGGAGADVGNRTADIRLHEGSDQYWRTPDRIVGEPPPLESAHHARDASRR
jgi:hypothetical protein